eukprot:m.109073 g.109073  ORF g.109073 m.109073 type:complete len:191 (-) comp15951_c1_seq1:149-721(-)
MAKVLPDAGPLEMDPSSLVENTEGACVRRHFDEATNTLSVIGGGWNDTAAIRSKRPLEHKEWFGMSFRCAQSGIGVCLSNAPPTKALRFQPTCMVVYMDCVSRAGANFMSFEKKETCRVSPFTAVCDLPPRTNTDTAMCVDYEENIIYLFHRRMGMCAKRLPPHMAGQPLYAGIQVWNSGTCVFVPMPTE